MNSEKRRRIPQSETRRELLETGAVMIFEQGLRPGFDIKVKDVVERAQRTTGSAYQIWASQQDFQDDLAAHIARSVEYAAPPLIEALAGRLVSEGADLEQVIVECGGAYLKALVKSPEFYVCLHFWTALESLPPTLVDAVRESYQSVQGDFEGFFGRIFDIYGRKIRKPHSLQALTQATTALTEGSALRHRFCVTDSERHSVIDAYTATLWAMTESMTAGNP